MHELHKLCTSFSAVCTLWISIDREVLCLPFLVELEFENDGFWGRVENRSTWRKIAWSKVENQQQTPPTYGVDAEI